jgi:4-hydroxybenzoate polyprenyltransferase
MSNKRWRVLAKPCMYIELGKVIHSYDYEVQHMDVKLTREKGVRVTATRLTEEEAIAMAKLLNASATY